VNQGGEPPPGAWSEAPRISNTAVIRVAADF
jgi:hypothetical protein